MALEIRSSAFADGAEIPRQYTCQGGDRSPPLAFAGAPRGTRSLVLVVDDPDAPDPAAPRMTFVHWLLYDLPADCAGLAEGTTSGTLPPGAREGYTDYHRGAWGGPCPPIGRHRYFFKLYALDVALGDLGQPTKATLEAAMKGHVLAEARMHGTYQKQRP